jgi:phosphatidylglycerol lysyltransferase
MLDRLAFAETEAAAGTERSAEANHARPAGGRSRPSKPAAAVMLAGCAMLTGADALLDTALIGPLLRKLALGIWHLPFGSGVALTAATGALAGHRMLRAFRNTLPEPTEDDMLQALDIVARSGNAAAGLVRLGDKKLMFSDCGQAFIMYACRGRSMVALFDPVGEPALWGPLVLKFIETAERQRLRPVFYQISPEFLPVARETGMKPYKLGEDAVVDLQSFSLAGGEWVKLRRSINRAERDGLAFEMIAADRVPAVMDELAHVSDLWLAALNAREKGFSLGTFKDSYVCATPVAVIRVEGRIAAFANILTTEGGDAFIDLMRSVPGVHRGAMDLLFVRIMEHLKAAGYRSLNLGMAPLSGLCDRSHTPLWNRIGHAVFEKGERFYNFRGVHAFKSKFDPHWQPRYLAVRGRTLPVAATLDVTLLIGGGVRGVLKR